MTNLAKLEFVALDITGKNYLSWILDAEIHLDAMGLGDTIKDDNETSSQNKAKAMIFLRHHLHEELKLEYLTIKDPLILWKNLKERYDHQKTVILPKARYDWIHLRLQDFKSVSEYNSAMFNISSKLKLCGDNITDEDMLEKTFTTFHASNMLLQQQYRERKFTKYSELISCLLVAEQNNELLLKNHQSRPTGSTPFPEANGTSFNKHRGNYVRGRGRGRGRGHGRNNQYRDDRSNNSLKKNNTPYHQKNQHGKGLQNKPSKGHENKCYRCGMEGHWSRTCRTSKHLVDLYQASIKEKRKGIETNFVDHNDLEDPMNYLDLPNGVDMTHLDVPDFFEDVDGKFDGLIGDGNVHTN